jgi:hypothetical protein
MSISLHHLKSLSWVSPWQSATLVGIVFESLGASGARLISPSFCTAT